jgi:hypothetical protein
MVPNARSEAERQRNRRVEIVVLTKAVRPVAGSRRSYLLVRGQRFVGKVGPRPDRSASVAFDKTRAAFRPVGVGHLQLSSVNLREDVLNAMDRLHVLWSINNTDYAREYPTVSGLPLASVRPQTGVFRGRYSSVGPVRLSRPVPVAAISRFGGGVVAIATFACTAGHVRAAAFGVPNASGG